MQYLPTVMQYSKYLDEVCINLNLTRNEARDKFGFYTVEQWKELLKQQNIDYAFLRFKKSISTTPQNELAESYNLNSDCTEVVSVVCELEYNYLAQLTEQELIEYVSNLNNQ